MSRGVFYLACWLGLGVLAGCVRFAPGDPSADRGVSDLGADRGAAEGLSYDAARHDAERDALALDTSRDAGLDSSPRPDGSSPVDIAREDAAPDLAPADVGADLAPVIDGGPVPTGFVALPPGMFSMGSPSAENCRYPNEDRHTVTLTRGFLIGRTEISRAEFVAKLGFDPSQASCSGSSCPVDSVSWGLAAAYCNALSAAEKLPKCYSCTGAGASTSCTAPSGSIYACKGYRLPTEAEWEYAYRAGTTAATYLGPLTNCVDDAVADKLGWYSRNASGLQPSGTLGPNGWKLYDMAGNLMELCHDVYVAQLGTASAADPEGPAAGTEHTLRGGSWGYQARSLRAAYRLSTATSTKGYFVGFRCARTFP